MLNAVHIADGKGQDPAITDLHVKKGYQVIKLSSF